MTTITTFDVLRCPLQGSNLLEAGAGTGKTFSLSFLYLRMVMEKGLLVEEILVTTFTNAATAELKARIFTTLQSAECCLHMLMTDSEQRAQYDDAFMVAVIQQAREGINDDNLLHKRLRLAIAQFDYAHIYTIDGFALQLLKEHSDSIDCYAPEDIVTDDSEFVQKAYLALAQENFAPLGEHAAKVGRAVASYSGKDLFSLLSSMIAHKDSVDLASEGLIATAQHLKHMITALQELDYSHAVASVAEAIEAEKLKKTSYSEAKLAACVAQLHNPSSFTDSKIIEFFSRSKLQSSLRKGAEHAFDDPFFVACDEMRASIGDLSLVAHIEDYQALLLLLEYISVHIQRYKAEQMALTYHDITVAVAAAAPGLRTTLRAALIDEAQDTNRDQMQLFKGLFLRPDSDNIVFFVGDPKQAIYGFRGANIYSYLAIEHEVDHSFVMDTNYRSTQGLNTSVNALFSGDKPFIDSRLTYHNIKWNIENTAPFYDSALTLVETQVSTVDGCAQAAAQAIIEMLQQHPTLQHSDVAILVRTTGQARAIQTALSTCGVAHSFTGKISLYESNEACWLLALLQAVNSGSVRLVKSLMLTPLFSYSLDEVRDSDTVNRLTKQLHDMLIVYRQRGFSVMFYRLVQQHSLAGRLLQSPDGKRKLTNFIQLFELLQASLQDQALSLAGLCDSLNKHIHRADSEAQLRLEDANAVSIMTIHSSKGLEFPVVCLPYFDYGSKGGRPSAASLLVSHEHQLAAPEFLKPQKLKAYVEAEEHAEMMRLAYVALTRAKYHNIIITKATSVSGKSKTAKSSKSTSMWSALMGTLATREAIYDASFTTITQNDLSVCDASNGVAQSTDMPTYDFCVLNKCLPSGWQLESFSRLQQQMPAHPPLLREHNDDEQQYMAPDNQALLDYPAGANPGTALHAVYEDLMESRCSKQELQQSVIDNGRRYLSRAELLKLPDPEALAQAIYTTAGVALHPHAFSLLDVDVRRQSIEMKFFMHLSPSSRQQLLRQFGLHASEGDLLPPHGYVHGYIDYCCEHDGKFYIVDYKSNRLGGHPSEYHRDAMHAEMCHHHYHLQALIYTVALCKHLRIDCKKRYEEMMGGYFYLFIRGMQQGDSTGVYHDIFVWDDILPYLGG